MRALGNRLGTFALLIRRIHNIADKIPQVAGHASDAGCKPAEVIIAVRLHLLGEITVGNGRHNLHQLVNTVPQVFFSGHLGVAEFLFTLLSTHLFGDAFPVNHRSDIVAAGIAHSRNIELQEFGPQLNAGRVRKVCRVREESSLVFGIPVEDINGLAQHFINRHGQQMLHLAKCLS